MYQQNIYEIVKQVLTNTLSHVSSNQIKIDSKLKDDLGLDSMSSLTFLMALEDNIDNFVVDPDTLDTHHLDTVGSITEYVECQLHRNFDNVA